MTRFLLLFYGDGADEPAPGSPEEEAYLGAWMAYDAAMREEDVLRGGEALELPSTARTVRVREGETLISDGPFAETKEFLGGTALIEVADRDAAIAWARRAPAGTTVEVRPIMELPVAP